jgi:hypothetical protein
MPRYGWFMTWEEEVRIITTVASIYHVDPLFIATIRKVENGGPGREFGIVSLSAPTYEKQLNLCCGSVRNKLIQYMNNPMVTAVGQGGTMRLVYSDGFIGYFASIYCPVGAENDPTKLNDHWLCNTRTIYRKFVKEGLV